MNDNSCGPPLSPPCLSECVQVCVELSVGHTVTKLKYSLEEEDYTPGLHVTCVVSGKPSSMSSMPASMSWRKGDTMTDMMPFDLESFW